MAEALRLLLDGLLRSTLNSGFILIFLSRELNAVPLCPVDKEVIKSQEVRQSCFGLAVLWVMEQPVSWVELDREVGAEEREGDLPWSPYSSTVG